MMGFDGFDTLDVLKFIAFALIASTTAIAGLARARREDVFFWGGVCAGGFLALPVFVMFVIVPKFMNDTFARERRPFWFIVSTVLWVGGLALYLRYFAGRNRTQPDGMWTCPNCTYLNKEYDLAWEACSQPYSKPGRRS